MWINIRGTQLPQINCMVNRLMAVPCHQDLSSLIHSRRHRRQDRPGASIDTVKTLRHTIKPCDILLGPFQNILSMMQVIKPVNLRNIPLHRKIPLHSQRIPLMPRHMKRIKITLTVRFQFLV